MVRVLYAWEIGEDLGHIYRFQPIAARLRSMGADIAYALRDLSRARLLRHSPQVRLYQAPCNTRSRPVLRNNKSYPQTLFNHGFGDADDLAARLSAWRLLLKAEAPQIVVCDLAPTAQWAAQSLGITTASFGTGFECPPPAEPMPLFIAADQCSVNEAMADEQIVNQAIARVCQSEQLAPASIQSILNSAGANLLATYPQLDAYGARSDVIYYGSWAADVEEEARREDSNITQEIPFAAPEIFGYLKYQPGIDFIVGTLAGLDRRSLLYIDGVPSDFVSWFRGPNLQFISSPADFARIARTAQLVISNGNHGTTSFFLSRGIPVIMIPLHVEQWSHSLRAQTANLGRIIDLTKLAMFPSILRQVSHDKGIKAAAKHFAEQAATYPEPTTAIAQRLLEIAGTALKM